MDMQRLYIHGTVCCVHGQYLQKWCFLIIARNVQLHVLLQHTVICGKCQKLMDALFICLYAQKLMQVRQLIDFGCCLRMSCLLRWSNQAFLSFARAPDDWEVKKQPKTILPDFAGFSQQLAIEILLADGKMGSKIILPPTLEPLHLSTWSGAHLNVFLMQTWENCLYVAIFNGSQDMDHSSSSRYTFIPPVVSLWLVGPQTWSGDCLKGFFERSMVKPSVSYHSW